MIVWGLKPSYPSLTNSGDVSPFESVTLTEVRYPLRLSLNSIDCKLTLGSNVSRRCYDGQPKFNWLYDTGMHHSGSFFSSYGFCCGAPEFWMQCSISWSRHLIFNFVRSYSNKSLSPCPLKSRQARYFSSCSDRCLSGSFLNFSLIFCLTASIWDAILVNSESICPFHLLNPITLFTQFGSFSGEVLSVLTSYCSAMFHF